MSVLLKFNNALLLLVNIYIPLQQNKSQVNSLWAKVEGYLILAKQSYVYLSLHNSFW